MKFPRLSRKTWIAIGLVVLLGVLVFMGKSREGMENPPTSELLARAQAIITKLQGAPVTDVPLVAIGLLPYTKDSSLQVDPSLMKLLDDPVLPTKWDEYEQKLTSLASFKVTDATQEVTKDLIQKLGAKWNGYNPALIDTSNIAIERSVGAGPGSTPADMWEKIRALFKKVFSSPSQTPTTPSPSAPPSSATYSASCSKCSVINNQITCACDVLPK